MSATASAVSPFVRSIPAPSKVALQALRRQAAYLRALLDEVERAAPASPHEENFSEQVIEELARLGCRSLEAASELSLVSREP